MNTQKINTFTDLQGFVSNYDESQNVDFKVGYNSSKKHVAKVAKIIASFSNATGGRLIFGIEDKTLDFRGCDAFPINDYKNLTEEELENGLRGKSKVHLTQPICFELTKITQDAKIFIIVDIPQSNGLIGYRMEPNRPWEFWQRTGRQTSILEIHQIIRLAHQSESYQNKLKISLRYLDRLVAVSGALRLQILAMYGINPNITRFQDIHVPSDRSPLKNPLDIKPSLMFGIVRSAKRYYPEYQMRTYYGVNLDEHTKLFIDKFVGQLEPIVSNSMGHWGKSQKKLEKMVKKAKAETQTGKALDPGHQLRQNLQTCNNIINSHYDFYTQREVLKAQLYE